jgi:hypothetical protein
VYAYWSSLTGGAFNTAAAIAADMLPILGAIAGLAVAERVLGMIRRNIG